jgi:hypothetical protein
MAGNFDPRITPARPDLAAAFLKGKVDAARFVEGEEASICIGRASLRASPGDDAAQDSELLYGERVIVYERSNGWAWAQADNDFYVGYVREDALIAPFMPELRVHALMTPVYRASDLKSPVRDFLPLNAEVGVLARDGDYLAIAPGTYVHRRHLALPSERESDFVSVAERFIGAPYVWGGKTFAGLDCSGLVQTALQACGIKAPRDTDMMEASLGVRVAPNDLRRGDLVFWKGHMGVMRNAETLLHANAFHMEVFSEPVTEAIARIAQAAFPVTSVKRLIPPCP